MPDTSDASTPHPRGRDLFSRRNAPRSPRQEPTSSAQWWDTPKPPSQPTADTTVPRAVTEGRGRNLPVAIAVGVVLATMFLGSILWDPLAFTGVIALFVAFAVVEAAAELRKVGIRTCVPAMVVGGLAMVFGAYRSEHAGQIAGMLVLFFIAVIWQLADPNRRDVARNLSVTILLGVWTGLLGSFGVLLITRPDNGIVAVLAVIGAAIFGDIGGYAVGVRFGRTTIAPTVSPHKTLEGLVGGLVLAAGLAAAILPAVGDLFTPVTAAAVAAVSVLAGFMGDLTESMVKRDLGIKDFGALLPGHGGVLDRVDGILIALPVGFYAITLLT